MPTHNVAQHHELAKALEKTYLPFRFTFSSAAFSRNTISRLGSDTQSFFMDIRQFRNRRGKTANLETFVFFLGYGNDIRVLSCDIPRRQILISVSEPERVF